MFFSEQIDTPTDPAFAELLRLASNAEAANNATTSDSAPSLGDAIDRWHDLFNYDHDTAARLIIAQRQNIMAEQRISNEHWDLIRHRWEPLGYDKEAYEHAQRLEEVLEASAASVSGSGAEMGGSRTEDGGEIFVFRLGGLLDSVERVREITGMADRPVTMMTESGGGGMVELCVVGMEDKAKIHDFLRSKRVGR